MRPQVLLNPYRVQEFHLQHKQDNCTLYIVQSCVDIYIKSIELKI